MKAVVLAVVSPRLKQIIGRPKLPQPALHQCEAIGLEQPNARWDSTGRPRPRCRGALIRGSLIRVAMRILAAIARHGHSQPLRTARLSARQPLAGRRTHLPRRLIPGHRRLHPRARPGRRRGRPRLARNRGGPRHRRTRRVGLPGRRLPGERQTAEPCRGSDSAPATPGMPLGKMRSISTDLTTSGNWLPKIAASGTTIKQATNTSARNATTVDDSMPLPTSFPDATEQHGRFHRRPAR